MDGHETFAALNLPMASMILPLFVFRTLPTFGLTENNTSA